LSNAVLINNQNNDNNDNNQNIHNNDDQIKRIVEKLLKLFEIHITTNPNLTQQEHKEWILANFSQKEDLLIVNVVFTRFWEKIALKKNIGNNLEYLQTTIDQLK
jgi:hypothetical protein